MSRSPTALPESGPAGQGGPETPEPWLPFAAGLRAFVRRRVPAQEADDVTQEVLLRLHRGAGSLRDGERAEAWIYSIARRTIADFFRRRRPAEPLQEADDATGNADPELKGFGDFSGSHSPHEEVLSWLRPMVEELPSPYREALLATDFDGRTQRQLAQELGLSVSGVKSRVQRARKMLGEALQRCCEVELGGDGRVSDFRRKDCSC